MEQCYKLKDVASKLAITRRTLYRWIDTGQLNIVRINGHPRVLESELQRLVNNTTKGE